MTRDPVAQQRGEEPRRGIPAGAFAWSAASGFLLLLVMQSLWIVWLTYGRRTASGAGWFASSPWPWFTTLLLAWGLLNLRWGSAALRRFRIDLGYGHLGILLCCGLAAIGLQIVFAARTLSDAPIVMDYSHLGRPRSVPITADAAPIAGDATEGKKLFAMSCVTCHGPTGDGLNNLAPSLRASEFVRSADTTAILQVIKLGRAQGDPANKSGKVMPARGGNPFLKDEQAAHLAAFVKSLPDAAPAAAATDTATAVQPTKWVVPPAANPPEGLVSAKPGEMILGTDFYLQRSNERRAVLVQNLGLAALAIHLAFTLSVLLLSSHLLFAWLLGMRSKLLRARFTVAVWGWIAAGTSWLVIGILWGVS